MTDISTLPSEKPIILIGMMGAGKTTVGRFLAKALAREFIDLDHAIVERCGVNIPTIFDIEGEEGFRKREHSTLQAVIQQPNLVLATGGGAILAQPNRQLLDQHGIVIYLKVDISELWRRVSRDKNRPLLQTAQPRKALKKLMDQRSHLYESAAHYTIESKTHSAHHVVEQIKQQLAQETV
ncbi:shikimate kinase [Brackiella oedipodis]|uniref:shikimate kinase n=1 Tax=Brackiella oedipodis TaxID=124225 RepID=UPI00048C2EFA|nr:shikimate kinase [Brackiella oedipodis]